MNTFKLCIIFSMPQNNNSLLRKETKRNLQEKDDKQEQT